MKLEDLLPKKKLGYLFPLSVVDYTAYQYYQLLPSDIMVVWVPVGLREFTVEDVHRALAPLEEYAKAFVEQGVEVIIQGGVPLPAIIGVKEHDEVLKRMHDLTGLPVTSDMDAAAKAAKSLGIKKIAVANKWSVSMNNVIGQFFQREGITVTGVSSQSMIPAQFLKMTSSASINLAYELASNAFKAYPESEGLFLAGGAWITFPLVDLLEKEFGRPVITNETGAIWYSRHLINYWKPITGRGRLLASA